MKPAIIVCGGSKGIGAATVKKLLKDDFQVICVSRSEGEIAELISSDKHLTHIPLDISNTEMRLELCERISTFKNVYGLINNSSGPSTGPMEEASTSKYLDAFNSHLFAADDLVKAVIPNMKELNQGRIVNIISVTAKIPLENMCVSNTLRGAMLNWSKTLSKEFGKYNITVNNVLPGYTNTQRLKEVISGVSQKMNISEKDYESKLLSQVPLARFGKSEEVASVVAFLISENSSFVSGASIPVDGGWTPCP